ncbi:costars family protein ABRACL isoform 1-T1 [Thomomys bottae]
MNVDHEVNLLVEEIHRLGSKNADGQLSVKFGVLFRDDKCANLFEALVGTLKAAKRRKIVTYPGELLLQAISREGVKRSWHTSSTNSGHSSSWKEKKISACGCQIPQDSIRLPQEDSFPEALICYPVTTFHARTESPTIHGWFFCC